MPLSLSPRYDLIRFALPKTFIPEEVEQKYTKYINKDSYVIKSAIEYLNESIQGINIPGLNGLTSVQQQHGRNGITHTGKRLNVEPMHEINYLTPENPLEKMEKEFKVTFRKNQGLINYFMLYETAFHLACREFRGDAESEMYLEILSEDGTAIAKVTFFDVHMEGIEGVDFNYSKIEREAGTFDVTFKFNNIDFEYFINEDYK